VGWACRKDVGQQNEVWKEAAKSQGVLEGRGIDGKKTCRRTTPYCQIHITGGKMWERLEAGNRGDHDRETGRTAAVRAGHYADKKQTFQTLTRGMYSYH
jgi:hypothetical protein